jgi:hypothetical protein
MGFYIIVLNLYFASVYIAGVSQMYIASVFGEARPTQTPHAVISSQTEPVAKYRICVEYLEGCVESADPQYVYRLCMPAKRRVKLNTLCDYLLKKLDHCTEKRFRRDVTYYITVRANLQWLISVLEVEFDYHLGKKKCTKKCNEKYMIEYMATQLSGFGDLFYHPTDNISNSIIAKLYPMNVEK